MYGTPQKLLTCWEKYLEFELQTSKNVKFNQIRLVTLHQRNQNVFFQKITDLQR